MYRPTVRMDDQFKLWVNDVTNATTLDRNQIMRLSLFVAGYSKKFNMILENYLRPSVTSLPFPSWEPVEHGLWLNQTYERGVGVTSQAIDVCDFELIDRRGEQVERKNVIGINSAGIIRWNLD